MFCIYCKITIIQELIEIRCEYPHKKRKNKHFDIGVDYARFELFVNRFIKHLFAPNIAKICSMIKKLGIIT